MNYNDINEYRLLALVLLPHDTHNYGAKELCMVTQSMSSFIQEAILNSDFILSLWNMCDIRYFLLVRSKNWGCSESGGFLKIR